MVEETTNKEEPGFESGGPQPTPEKPVKEEEVKETLRMMMDEIHELKKDRDILMQSADKRALARYYSRHKKDMPPVVRLRTMEVYDKETKKTATKLIIGWRMIEDKGSYKIPGTDKWTESQIIEVIYKDGTSEKMQLMAFVHSYKKDVRAKRIGIIKDDRTGKEALKLSRLDNGEELTIGVEFVN